MIKSEIADIRNNPHLNNVATFEIEEAFANGKSIDYVAKLDAEMNKELQNPKDYVHTVFVVNRVNPHTGVIESVEAS